MAAISLSCFVQGETIHGPFFGEVGLSKSLQFMLLGWFAQVSDGLGEILIL